VKLLRQSLFGCFALALCASGLRAQQVTKPDVFLITIDTLRADHVHCYGYKDIETPGLDGLAEDGIRFTNAFTPSPITNTSHTSILTGLLPTNHGVADFGMPLAASHSTLAQLLHAQGYRTAAFIGSVILDSRSMAPGLDRGFDFYDNFPQHTATKSRWGRLERRGMEVVQHSEAWLAKQPTGPRFMWMHFYDPHDPYEPPAPFSQRYKKHLYDGEIAYADSAIASFIGYLKKHGLYKNAVIVVVGDHGEGLGEHNEDTHGIFLYDSTTHVPLLVKLPVGQGRTKRTVEAQVRTIDILPTVLDLVGANAIPAVDGQSLKILFAGAESAQRIVFGESEYPLRFGWAPLRSVRAYGSKFIEAPRSELYELGLDPRELENKYAPWDQRVQSFRALLAELRAKTPSPDRSKSAVSQETLDELEALGYLGNADAGSATEVPESSLLPDPKDKIEQQNLLHLAMVASEDDRLTSARQALEKVLQLDPKSPIALRQLGELELHEGEYVTAAERLQAALDVNPDDARAGLLTGEALQKAHKLEAARDVLETSLKHAPGQVLARLLLGQIYLELRNYGAAADEFEAAMLVQPTSEEAELGLARIEIARGAFADALARLTALSRSQNPEVFELRAKALTAMGKTGAAHHAEERARELRRAKPKSKATTTSGQ
jgi:choline-sulfatase